jgi:hypothetical protein
VRSVCICCLVGGSGPQFIGDFHNVSTPPPKTLTTTNFQYINYSNDNELCVSVRQCTLSVQKLNICTVIFYYIQRRLQKKKSCNKIKITIFHYILYCNSNYLKILLKRTLSSYISYVLTVYSLLVLMFLKDVSCVSLTAPK